MLGTSINLPVPYSAPLLQVIFTQQQILKEYYEFLNLFKEEIGIEALP